MGIWEKIRKYIWYSVPIKNENLGEDYFAEFEFDFSIPHEELMKQTVHKKLEDVSVKTEEGTVKLTDFSMNKLQSIITAEIPEELEEKLYNGNEMMLMGTDSKGNQVQYELRSNSADGKSQWSFKTSFWGMYQLDSDGPVLLLPDIDSDYLELQLYTREPYMAAADTVWVDDDFVEIGETTEEVEEVQRILWREKIRQMQRSRLKLKLSEGQMLPQK